MAVTYPAAEATDITLRIKSAGRTLKSYASPTADTNVLRGAQTLELAASASDTVVNLKAMVDTLKHFWISVLSTGNSVLATVRRDGESAPANTDNHFRISSAQGILFCSWHSAELPPQVYLTNPSGTDTVLVEVGYLGDSAP
jgi:hypothetical protein